MADDSIRASEFNRWKFTLGIRECIHDINILCIPKLHSFQCRDCYWSNNAKNQ